MARADQQTGRWWHLRWGDLGRGAAALLGSALGLGIASWVVPDFDIGGVERAVVGAVLIAVVGAVLRPVLVRLAVLLGWVGAILIGLTGQAIVIWLVVWDFSGEQDNPAFLSVFVASWIVAGVSTALVWVATAGTDDAVTAGLLRRARRSRPPVLDDPDLPGVVFIQADGVPFPVLEWGVRAGTLPTLSRWVRSGSHRMAEWRPKLPATTPASQMGILHGTIDGIPAFRWLERSTGQVLVANKPADAAVIEARHSDGLGLLADDGVSVSNLFTGDAPTAYATMSAVHRTRETKHARFALSTFLARPDGMARSLSRTVSEIVRERFQSSRARRRDVHPRVARPWGFAFERAALSGVLRDLNTTLVADSMLQGRRSVYVDYVDYDAVAHHAGLMQPESLAALEGIDAVIGQLERVAAVAPRTYHFVVLSDHGQSQGEVFASRYGEDLAALVRRLSALDVLGAEENAEASGSLNSVMASTGGTDTVLGRALSRASDRLSERKLEVHQPAVGKEGAAGAEPAAGSEPDGDGFVVFGSGNLGLVYVAGEKQRLTLDQLTERFPALLPGLVTHPGIGFAVVDTADHGPVVLGARGEHRVREGVVVGDDPLAAYGPEAAEFVLRAASMDEAPDIYVNSLVDDLGEVAAFEGLVGCHGGLGGWQDRAMVVWPAELPPPGPMVVGADAMHRLLVGWLEHLGHRGSLGARETSTAPARTP
ncbi:phage holin family protein [Nocardioides sp. MAHUQ-72]|uniref:phage holin family protein n=1 Tax=unclassified Nocardioides TaxID=2615069 RepID=UPI00361DB328